MQYYGGVNAEGFAVENSNSYNLPEGPGENGWPGSDDDGEIHTLALATCRTVDDFEVLMDSLNEDGRTLESNYGTFDAFGGVAMFEAGGYSYERIDAIDTEEGFIVRANYSYTGSGLDSLPFDRDFGANRHNRALEFWKELVENNTLTPENIYQLVVRNLCPPDMEDYAMPFEGYYRNYPYGCISNSECVNRVSTRGALVAQGVRPNENPLNCVIWAMVGNPIGAIATPLWVRSGSVPEEYDSNGGSRMCYLAKDILNYVTVITEAGRAVDTWRLRNMEGTGYYDWALRLESMVFERADAFRNNPNNSPDRYEAFQNLIARQIADSIEVWEPTEPITETSGSIFFENHLVLFWDDEIENENLLNRWGEPRGYNIYRSDEPFLNRECGEFLAFVEETTYTDENPPDGGGFYRIGIVY